MIRCELCGVEIKDNDVHELDDSVVCVHCYSHAVEMDGDVER